MQTDSPLGKDRYPDPVERSAVYTTVQLYEADLRNSNFITSSDSRFLSSAIAAEMLEIQYHIVGRGEKR